MLTRHARCRHSSRARCCRGSGSTRCAPTRTAWRPMGRRMPTRTFTPCTLPFVYSSPSPQRTNPLFYFFFKRFQPFDARFISASLLAPHRTAAAASVVCRARSHTRPRNFAAFASPRSQGGAAHSRVLQQVSRGRAEHMRASGTHPSSLVAALLLPHHQTRTHHQHHRRRTKKLWWNLP